MPSHMWQGVETAVQAGCIRARRLWEVERQVCSLLKMYVFILSAITVVGHQGAIAGQ